MSWSFDWVGDAKAISDKVRAELYWLPDLKAQIINQVAAMEASKKPSDSAQYYQVKSNGHVDAGAGGGNFNVSRAFLVLDKDVKAPEAPAEAPAAAPKEEVPA